MKNEPERESLPDITWNPKSLVTKRDQTHLNCDHDDSNNEKAAARTILMPLIIESTTNHGEASLEYMKHNTVYENPDGRLGARRASLRGPLCRP